MNSLLSIFRSIVGDYTPIIDPSTGMPYEGISGWDWSYIGTCALLLLTFWAVFKIFMGVLSRRR